MPELPEVETVRRSLLKHLVAKDTASNPISRVEVFNPVVLATKNQNEFIALEGFTIDDITRRGKYLLFHVSKNQKNKQIMVVHLRMTGKLLFAATDPPLVKHSHVKISFSQGQTLTFVDVRRFGRLWLIPQEAIEDVSGLSTLALEPIDENFSLDYWQNKIKNKKKAMVKAVLLDQHMVAGLGNIYADEVLFAAKVHPQRQIQSLTNQENASLCVAMKEILAKAIELRGTSFRDYVDGDNQKGEYQNFLAVFMQSGKPCPNCGTIIEKIKVAGRSSCFCPQCQKQTDQENK